MLPLLPPRSASRKPQRLRSQSTPKLIAAFEHVLETSPSLPTSDREALRKTIAMRYYDYGSYLLREGERSASRQHLVGALRYGSTDWRVFAKFALGFLPHRIFSSLRELRLRLFPLDHGTEPLPMNNRPLDPQ